MLFELGCYVLDIDVERTKAFYARAEMITAGCKCQGCRNYEQWATSLSSEPKCVLERMGVLLEKTPEMYVNGPNHDGTLFYGGFYHLCGTIVRGKDSLTDIEVNKNAFDEGAFVSLTKDFKVAFTDNIALLEKEFPTPVIQMEVLANIPFVLTEHCDY